MKIHETLSFRIKPLFANKTESVIRIQTANFMKIQIYPSSI